MSSEQQAVFDTLVCEPPEAWLAYLRHHNNEESTAGLSTDVIFHHASVLAKSQSSLAWARVAIEAVELSAERSSGVEREAELLRAMRLRSWFISKVGSRLDDYVLDKGIIMQWVFAGLSLTPHGAMERASVLWEKMRLARDSGDAVAMHSAVADLRELRQIKHRLDVAKLLADAGELVHEPSLDEWLKIRAQLP